MNFEELRKDWGWLFNSVASALTGAAVMWAAAWRKMLRVQKRQEKLETIVMQLRKEHDAEVQARRRQQAQLDDMGGQLSRIEGQVDIIASVVTRPPR